MKIGTSGLRFELSEKVLYASFKMSQLMANNIGEKLLKPYSLNDVEKVLGEEAKKKMQEIHLL